MNELLALGGFASLGWSADGALSRYRLTLFFIIIQKGELIRDQYYYSQTLVKYLAWRQNVIRVVRADTVEKIRGGGDRQYGMKCFQACEGFEC